MTKECRTTMTACFIGYITQAILTNFVPLLYLEFQQNYDFDFKDTTIIIAVNFTIQLLVDLFSSKYVTRIGYRRCLVGAHLLCGTGFVLLTILPFFLNYFTGVLISVIIYATGAGLLEVILSPVVESCPTKNKAGIMSFLHSFYCWGVVATVFLSTIFFTIFSIKSWKVLTCIWALVPFINAYLFLRVKLYPIDEEQGYEPNYKKLFKQKVFWILMVIMVCAGACEQTLSQWGSTIAELALDTSKTISDLFAVCGFAIMMGLSRLIYSVFSKKLSLPKAIFLSAILCAVSLLLIGMGNSPLTIVLGFALCGFSIGVFWPGTFSLASKVVCNGGTTMFAMLALAGDLGCTGGPSIVGGISHLLSESPQAGVVATVFFPVSTIVALLFLKKAMPNKLKQKAHNN